MCLSKPASEILNGPIELPRKVAKFRGRQTKDHIMDCLINYFGIDENERPTYRRYYIYHIIAGPGPTAGSGVAAIKTLATNDGNGADIFGQDFHAVDKGGPAAAIAKAMHYLDIRHDEDRLWRVQSAIRGLDTDFRMEVVALAARVESAERHNGVNNSKE
jgi:hypothetical protein